MKKVGQDRKDNAKAASQTLGPDPTTPEPATPKPRAHMKLLGFLACSPTAVAAIAVFPIMPGFNAKSPKADVDALILRGPDWKGYTLTMGNTGTLKVKALPKPKK